MFNFLEESNDQNIIKNVNNEVENTLFEIFLQIFEDKEKNKLRYI